MKTKDKILETALQLFNEKGFSNVGVREIARELDISPGNLSYHFSKKEDIFFELIKRYSMQNDQHYEDYFSGEKSIEHFLLLMRKVMKSQYRYRGIFLSFSFITQDIKQEDRSNYYNTDKKRKAGARRIFEGLIQEKQLEASPADVDFLLSFFTLFGRFSILKPFLWTKKGWSKDVLRHYLGTLQMSFFASETGKASIARFEEAFL
ncbi:MAG: TetR/AcrR family transcriptional regulator [Bacteroidia bacterium]